MIKLIRCTAFFIAFSGILFQCAPAFSREVKLSEFNISPANKNNTEGFLNLSKWLKGKSDVTINFKKGTYYVGMQKSSNKTVVENISSIFSIVECSRITINGNGATIKFVDGLLFGTFDIGTKKKLTHTNTFTKRENAAYPGDCIFIHKSNDVTVQNLTLDGNGQKMVIGGKFGDKGIQLTHRGIHANDSYDIKLSGLYIHHFGLDGIEVATIIRTTGKSPYQTQIFNTRCMFNGRQGISWTGGNGLYIINSEFSNTGKANITTSPGTGIDIEPEFSICENGRFINCKFENNSGYAFGTDHFNTPIRDIIFTKCTFGGTNSGALFPSNGGLTIDNCIIYGPIIKPAGLSKNERMVIKNCKIYDYNPTTGKLSGVGTGHIIDAGSASSYYDFLDCTFYLRKVKLCFIDPGKTDPAEFPSFQRNTVYFEKNVYKPKDFIALFRSCLLANNTFVMAYKDTENNGNFLAYSGTVKLKGVNKIIGNNQFIGWNKSNGPKTLQ